MAAITWTERPNVDGLVPDVESDAYRVVRTHGKRDTTLVLGWAVDRHTGRKWVRLVVLGGRGVAMRWAEEHAALSEKA